MGLFDFVKDAGERIFGKDEDDAPRRELDQVLADKETGKRLTALVRDLGMRVDDFRVKFRDGKATLTGKVASRTEGEKIILMVGNTQGVAQVEDLLELRAAEAKPAEPEAVMYTVKAGDSLSKIAKAHYGDAMKYGKIFEANRPMLKNPDRIYPGQVLRIPPLDS